MIVTNIIDGNKRTGAVTGIIFLMINKIDLVITDENLFKTTLLVSEGKLSKSDLAVILRGWYKNA